LPQRLNVRFNLCSFQYIKKKEGELASLSSFPCIAWKIGDAGGAEPRTGTCNDRVGKWWKFTLVKLLVGILKDGVIGAEVFDKLDHTGKVIHPRT